MSKTEALYTAIKNGRLDSVENYLSQPGKSDQLLKQGQKIS